MDQAEKLERLFALNAALREARPRPDKLPAWFCASGLLTAEGEPQALAAAVRARVDEISALVGRHRAPSGALRWIYAALMTARGVPVERFAAARETLREARKASKTGPLHAGGSRAALMLCLLSDQDTPVERFYAMKQALQPPWWRRDPSVTDTFAAAHAARGDDARAVLQARDRAETVFKEHRRTRHYKITAARLCALLEQEPRTVLRRFEALDAARQATKSVRHRIERSMTIDWAANGLEPGDLQAIAALRDALPDSVSTMGSGRTRLAHLVHTAGETRLGGEIAAMTAVIAAQTAMIVAISTASTVAVTSSS